MDKYEYLTGEDLEYKPCMLEIEYSQSGKVLNNIAKQTKHT